MNRLIITIIAAFVFCSCTSQKNTKLYGYRQATIGGARGPVIDEKGKEVDMPGRERVSFFIYLETPGEVQVKEVWMKQKPYAAKGISVVTTPVVLKGEMRVIGEDTLVKATQNKVWQIDVGLPVPPPTVPAAEQKKIAANELVIRCLVNGRERYYALASIKTLTPVALQ